jgi:hypothetical protein
MILSIPVRNFLVFIDPGGIVVVYIKKREHAAVVRGKRSISDALSKFYF